MTLALITKGFRYGGRILELDATTLASATGDGWGVDLTGKPYPFDAQAVDRYGAEPASMKDWIDVVDGVVPPPPQPVAIIAISKDVEAVVTVAAGDIGKFSNAMTVTIAGVAGEGWTVCNGNHLIDGISGNTFVLTGVDTTAATETAPTTLGTVTPPAP